MDVPLKETGRDGDRITVVIDMGPFRQHMTGHQSAEERL
jgi:hypothetical protein